ncbi:hypothetical protein LYSHEL_07300 [Lysobacter helvus]|uniref:Uncharacterized protein n=2 Tax=Lysobacteraceae TaxID=32033 RepID=A0ABN6FQ04_9GAMM|nr:MULTISPECIES: hypothetical protein [Lysobacter]BCT91706.1 hypothetical protein LYSCAS_07300 [Lysobacter caseinilyticus]BCT94859.1 hypothetical protein LYSHEL_07300 [Lysobacter helvus]
MQYLISPSSHVASLDRIADRLNDLDPSALIDVDAAGRLRVSTLLPDAELLLALGMAGLLVAPCDVEQLPSECCGGCGG